MLLWTLLVACSSHTTPQPGTTPDTTWTAPDATTLTLTTRDGVDLVADYYPVDEAGAPAVLLLHMTPSGGFQRTDWPTSFIADLNGHGWTVLVPDRRGAGDSGGNAVDAYEGEGGRWDVEACTSRLTADGYGELAIIGASNGTTSTLDYALWARSEGLPEPVALGFMTGGDYTENQNAMEDLGDVPSIFTYSTVERAWSVRQMDLGESSWVFKEYAEGDHGTKMFTAAPEVSQDLVDFLVGVL